MYLPQNAYNTKVEKREADVSFFYVRLPFYLISQPAIS